KRTLTPAASASSRSVSARAWRRARTRAPRRAKSSVERSVIAPAPRGSVLDARAHLDEHERTAVVDLLLVGDARGGRVDRLLEGLVLAVFLAPEGEALVSAVLAGCLD